jgi:uncharacterized protein YecT (DUF1311 family)
MRKVLILVPTLVFAAITTASAEECDNLKTQLDMNQCAAAQFQQLDAELNKVYAEYRSRLNDNQKHQFKNAELAWVKYRGLSCTFESSGVEGGSVHPFIFQSCLAEKTRVRLKELTLLTNCEEGDLSCPAWK